MADIEINIAGARFLLVLNMPGRRRPPPPASSPAAAPAVHYSHEGEFGLAFSDYQDDRSVTLQGHRFGFRNEGNDQQ